MPFITTQNTPHVNTVQQLISCITRNESVQGSESCDVTTNQETFQQQERDRKLGKETAEKVLEEEMRQLLEELHESEAMKPMTPAEQKRISRARSSLPRKYATTVSQLINSASHKKNVKKNSILMLKCQGYFCCPSVNTSDS